MKIMTQEKANKIFNSSLGRQLSVIYVAPDDAPFIRLEEAERYCREVLQLGNDDAPKYEIKEWYPEEKEQLETTKTGIELIAEERQKQVEKIKPVIDIISDDFINNGENELLRAACSILYTPEEASPLDLIMEFGVLNGWDKNYLYEINNKPYMERLAIAGAFIAREIDRMQRVEYFKSTDREITLD